jgi:hypothetical protein
MVDYSDFYKYYDDLVQFSKQPPNPNDAAHAFWTCTKEIVSFAEKVMIPVLKGIIQPNKREIALRDTYFRMCLWFSGMAKLDSPMYFQQAAVATRCLFELLLDLKILSNDKTNVELNKFMAFPQIEKYNKAKVTIDFFEKHPDLPSPDLSKKKIWITDPKNSEATIENNIRKYWGLNIKGRPNVPKNHWTGMDAKSRAKNLGIKYERFYIETYYWLSWYVHPGSTGYQGFDEDTFKAAFGMSHSLAQEIFLEATLICSHEFKLTSLDNLKKTIPQILEQLQMHPGIVLMQKEIEQIKKLKPISKSYMI